MECPIVELDENINPYEYVIAANIRRRHLTINQRALIAAKFKKIFEKEAKERQRLSCGRGKKGVKQVTHLKVKVFEPGKSRDAAGKLLGISGVLVERACKVLNNGQPIIVELVEADKLSLRLAAVVVDKLDKHEQLKIGKSDRPEGLAEALIENKQPRKRKPDLQKFVTRVSGQISDYLSSQLKSGQELIAILRVKNELGKKQSYGPY